MIFDPVSAFIYNEILFVVCESFKLILYFEYLG